MKTVSRIIVVLIILLGILVAGRNLIAKFAVEKGVKVATGLSLNIKKLDLGLATTHIGINGLSLLSPKEFGNEVMFYAPEIFVDYNLGAIIKGKVHIEDIRLNFDQLVIVRNKQGKTNLEALKPKAKKDQSSQETEKKDDASPKKDPKIQIDHLSLKIGKVVYKDYSQGEELIIKEYVLNFYQEINDVTNIQELLGTIATKVLAKTALSSLSDFNIDSSAVSEEAEGLLKSTAETLKEKMKIPFQQ